MKKVRVRFAPSPTGGLHLGGVRTALFNYLFARQHGGDFILRIEDTDQSRYVAGAEQYIISCLDWCGITPDEGPVQGGPYGPYRQSERKADYRNYAEQLVEAGRAYYAFDTPEDLDIQRKANPNFQYGSATRMQLKNSLALPAEEVAGLLASGHPHVIRIHIPEDETVRFTDMIRGEVSFDTNQVDDKVLLKADGMPTYHLAVVVDDHLMEISHAFRGEEWLPSAPVHLLLWEYLGWKAQMPQWAHLPLILKPDGNGKLSKRDGDRLGFPVFAMTWADPRTGDTTTGFRERGFLPEAFVNMLALLGWNDGTEQELFTLGELIRAFSIQRISKAGAKFDFEKAKWFNQEWIKTLPADRFWLLAESSLADKGITAAQRPLVEKVFNLVKERLTFTGDFWDQAAFFFQSPETYDTAAVKPRWTEQKSTFFSELKTLFADVENWTAVNLELLFKSKAEAEAIKPGELLLPFRIMLVGGKFGPQVFEIAEILGKAETVARIEKATKIFNY